MTWRQVIDDHGTHLKCVVHHLKIIKMEWGLPHKNDASTATAHHFSSGISNKRFITSTRHQGTMECHIPSSQQWIDELDLKTISIDKEFEWG